MGLYVMITADDEVFLRNVYEEWRKAPREIMLDDKFGVVLLNAEELTDNTLANVLEGHSYLLVINVTESVMDIYTWSVKKDN